MSAANVTGYIFAACLAGGAVAVVLPTIKAWIYEQSTKGRERQAMAKEWLKQFTPEQCAVIKNYLNHGGFPNGVSATIGDLNFLVLCGDMGETLRSCPGMLDRAILATPTPQD